MMSEIKNIFDISGRAMSAQLLRLNTVASNLANANNVSGTAEDAYRAIKPVFMPEHPKADNQGFIYNAAVNVEEEMVEMLEASRQYQNNIEVISTLRALMMRTIQMGK